MTPYSKKDRVKRMIRKIIINFPTNIGDAVLGLPALDKIKAKYPKAKITAVVSPRTGEFLKRNSFIDSVVLFDKRWPIKRKINFVMLLRGKFDLIIDFKNSFLPVLLGIRFRTPFVRNFPKNMHIKDKYLALSDRFCADEGKRGDFVLSHEEKQRWNELNLSPALFIACSSLTAIKSYPYPYLKKVVEGLSEEIPIVILGQDNDREFYKDILSIKGVVDLVGKTALCDVVYLLKNYANVLLAVDSSILHIGGYLDIPIVAFFGPTHPDRSAPFSQKFTILRNKKIPCIACEKSECNQAHECMKIEPQRVIEVIKKLW